MTTIVTTSAELTDTNLAKDIAGENEWLYIPRSEISDINDCIHKIIIVEKTKITLRLGQNKLFFHPGFSVLRIKNIRKGITDRMVEACSLRPGDTFLDCTLGLAADAIVAAYIVGDSGEVIGLEAVPEVAVVLKNGIEKFIMRDFDILKATKNIKIITSTAQNYLKDSNQTYDCIYFDPMFHKPNLLSSAMNMLRPFAYNEELCYKDIELALSKSKRCVVVKEMDKEKLKELYPDKIFGSKNAKIFYARWNK